MTHKRYLAIAGLLAATLGTWTACSSSQPETAAAPSASQASDIPTIPFEKITLANGLDVILSEDHRLPLVAVNLWYHVGPANEEPGRTGFAHLFEHMMFQESKHVPADTFFKRLEGVGASNVNGTTDFDRTNYFETVPSNQLELALWLESDRMGYLLDVVDQKSFENQQDVVRNERRQSVENRPYGIVDEAVFHQLFPAGHPYYASIIGSHADIQAAKIGDVKNFFKQYYAPNNASLAIVGDFDKAQVKQLVEKYFGTFKRGNPVPKPSAQTPKITRERRQIVKDRIELPRVTMAWLTSPILQPGDADADVTATLLGGGRSSRLYKSLVYDKQIAQSVTAYQQSLMLGSVFAIEATARPGHTADEIEKALDEELTKLRNDGPEGVEVDRARNQIETRIVEGLENLGGFGGVADRLNSYNHYLGDPGYLPKDIARYRAVTPASVKDFVQNQLAVNARVVVQAVPGAQELGPDVPAPKSTAVAGEGSESVNADESWRATQPAAGSAKPLQVPVPASFKLANGMTVLVNARPGLPVVSANLVVKTGSGANPLDKPGLANFTAAMLDEGVEGKTALQIADEVAQLGGALMTGSTMDGSRVTATSLQRTFPQMLALMADVVRRPSFPQGEVDRQRASRLASLVQQRDDPNAVANATMAAALFGPNHPYGFTELGNEASNKALTRDDMHAFWAQNFVPNNAALVVSGRVTVDELKPLVEKAFGDWQSGTPAQPAMPQPATTPARLIIVDKPGAPQTELRVVSLGAARSTPDYDPLIVMNEALGGLFSSRINLNLREKNGYTYGASSQFVFRRWPGPFLVAAGVRTPVTAPAASEMLKELKGIKDGVTDEELKLSKDSIVNSLAANFETSAVATATTSNIYLYDLGLDYYATFSSRINAVTSDQVKAVSQKYVDPSKSIVIAVGDRKTIGGPLGGLGLGAPEIRNTDGQPANAAARATR